jgi:HlyD family secretion protein
METPEPHVSQAQEPPDPTGLSETARLSTKPWGWIAVSIALLLLGTGIGRFLPHSTEVQPAVAQAQRPQQASPPRPVRLVTLAEGRAVRQVQLLGQVESSEQATIRAQTAGVVRRILVQEGDRLAPGETVAILDDTDQRLVLAEAEAQLAEERSNLARLEAGTRSEILAQRQAEVLSAEAREKEAKDNLRRTQELVLQGALSERLLVQARTAADEARGEQLLAEAELAEAKAGPRQEEIAAQRAKVAAAQAAVNQAQLALSRTQVRAGSGGVVQARQVSPGDLVQRADEMITLVVGDRLDVFLDLPEELSGQISAGLPVTLTTRSLPDWRESARITAVLPATDTTSRRQRVRVRLSEPPQGLLPGMAIAAYLELPGERTSFVVSRDALSQRQNDWFIFTVEDDQAKQIPVELVADMGTEVAIAGEGLQPGQAIVLVGADGLRDGMAVNVVE